MFVGPYTVREFNSNEIMELTEEYSLPPQFFNTSEKYFNNIPYLENDSTLLVLMNTLGETLWENMDHFKFDTLEQNMEKAEPHISQISTDVCFRANLNFFSLF